MKRRNTLAAALLLFCAAGVAGAQNNLGQLRSWAGKYPTDKRGKVTRNFFAVPAIRTPLVKLLSRKDYNLLTRAYSVQTPIKQIGDYLAVKVCMPHACNTDQAGFAINLSTGLIYVRMEEEGTEVRWFGSKGDYTDLPREVLNFLNDFSAT